MSQVVPVRRAIVSVADKAGLVPFGRALASLGVEIVSTGSTAALLDEAGVPVRAVADVTGLPRDDGRAGQDAASRHPRRDPGRQRKPVHLDQIAAQGIEPVDLVVVSLYPFRETVRGRGRLRGHHRTDRHRRADHGPRRREELRIGRCRRERRALRVGDRGDPASGRPVPRDPPGPGPRGVRARSPGTTRRSPAGSPRRPPGRTTPSCPEP